MVNKEEIFGSSGPKHLKDIVDWKNADHRRSVTASLVQGVYVLETDRQRKMKISKNPKNYAPPWWHSFNSEIHEYLKEDDGCIFGAIYKYINCPAPFDSNVPRYVIAFRGTLLKLDSGLKDVKLNLKCLFNELQESHRSRLAMRCVNDLVNSNGSSNVWLAGHSLGSAIALIVGRNMVLKRDCYLQAYLFNPPFASLPLEMLNMNENMKNLVRIARDIFKIGLAIAAEPNPQMQGQKADTFVSLSHWTPHLFVNMGDFVCSEYIAYFKNRVEAAPEMKTLSAKNCTTRNVLKHFALREDLKDAMHLLPSAHPIVNHPRPHKKTADIFTDFIDAHGIYQWWDREVRCQSTQYLYPQPTTKDPQ